MDIVVSEEVRPEGMRDRINAVEHAYIGDGGGLEVPMEQLVLMHDDGDQVLHSANKVVYNGEGELNPGVDRGLIHRVASFRGRCEDRDVDKGMKGAVQGIGLTGLSEFSTNLKVGWRWEPGWSVHIQISRGL